MQETKTPTTVTATDTAKVAPPEKAKPTVAEEVAHQKGYQQWAAGNDTDFRDYAAQYLFGFGYGKGATDRDNLVKLAGLVQARIEKLDNPAATRKSGC